ncbi:MAG: glycosyltransferase family 4 protein [Crocinitomicaceae bacterium]
MKVLFLTDGIYPFQLGGMQKHSLILTQLLAEKGVELEVVHCGGENYSAEKFEAGYNAGSVKEKMIPFPKSGKIPGHYIRRNKKYSQLIFDAYQKRLAEFDLIYAQGFTAWHFIQQKKKGNIFIPIAVNFHGFEMFQKPPSTRVKWEYKLFKKAVKFNVLNADFVYSFGGQITQILKDIGVPQEKIALQSNGITEDWIPATAANLVRNQVRTLTFIGRNERRKGVEELNTALAEIIKRKDFGFRFNFIGPIPADSQLKDERIIYHGEIRDAEKIKEVLHASDVLVCPSHSEGMPTVILEGMAIGLAIIATDVGAVSRQLNGNGILLEYPDPIKLKEAILEMINAKEKALNEMKSKSLEIVKSKFLWSVIADQKINDFERFVG